MLWARNVVFVCNTESIFLCFSTSEAEPPLLHITTLTTAYSSLQLASLLYALPCAVDALRSTLPHPLYESSCWTSEEVYEPSRNCRACARRGGRGRTYRRRSVRGYRAGCGTTTTGSTGCGLTSTSACSSPPCSRTTWRCSTATRHKATASTLSGEICTALRVRYT